MRRPRWLPNRPFGEEGLNRIRGWVEGFWARHERTAHPELGQPELGAERAIVGAVLAPAGGDTSLRFERASGGERSCVLGFQDGPSITFGWSRAAEAATLVSGRLALGGVGARHLAFVATTPKAPLPFSTWRQRGDAAKGEPEALVIGLPKPADQPTRAFAVTRAGGGSADQLTVLPGKGVRIEGRVCVSGRLIVPPKPPVAAPDGRAAIQAWLQTEAGRERAAQIRAGYTEDNFSVAVQNVRRATDPTRGRQYVTYDYAIKNTAPRPVTGLGVYHALTVKGGATEQIPAFQPLPEPKDQASKTARDQNPTCEPGKEPACSSEIVVARADESAKLLLWLYIVGFGELEVPISHRSASVKVP